METLTTIVKAVLEGSLAGKLVIGAVVVLVSLLAIISLQPKRPRATVQKLVIYPIKSCAGTEVGSIEYDARGLVGDRRYMIVSGDKKRFISQRQKPTMALIKPEIIDDGLQVSAPGMDDLYVTLVRPDDDAQLHTVGLWGDKIQGAVDQGDEAADWFTTYLSKPVRLVHMPNSCKRAVSSGFRRSGGSTEVSFADGFPLLVASEESMEEVNRRLPEGEAKMDINRFRPNIVVRGDPAMAPHAEESWRRITIGGSHVFYGVKRCTRCSMPSTNQETGAQAGYDGEPLKTLKSYRSPEKGVVTFGNNLMPRWRGRPKVTELNVMDEVIVEDIGSLPWK